MRTLPTMVALAIALALLLASGCSGDTDTTTTTVETPAETNRDAGPKAAKARSEGSDERRSNGRSKPNAEPSGGPGRRGGATEASSNDPLPEDLTADATPTDPEAIARMIPRAKVTREGRVQTLAPDPARHQAAQKNMYGSVREFGQETQGDQATAVTFALIDYLNALARSDWQRACDRLYSPLRESFEKRPDGATGECAETFGKILGRRSPAAHRRAMLLDVSSVRIGQDDNGDTRAFVIYKTPETLSADMPLYLEDGIWKVAAVEAYTLRPEQVG